MFKLLCYFLGVFLISISIFLMIIYLNLFTIGYSFLEFVKFINKRYVFLIFFCGIVLVLISLERWIRNELLLRHHFKLGNRL